MNDKKKPVFILTIETSGLTSGVSIGQDGELLAERALNLKNIHSRKMALMLKQLMEDVKLDYRDLAAIALSAGPGSFTGLRIGYSLAKGLAHPLCLPLIEVSTLDVWAYQQGKTDLPVMALIDAHRNEIFCGLYRWKQNTLHREGDYRLVPLKDLPALLREPTLIVGADTVQLKEKIMKFSAEAARFPFPFLTQPENWALLHLAFQKYQAGELCAVSEAEPRYMRAFKGVM